MSKGDKIIRSVRAAAKTCLTLFFFAFRTYVASTHAIAAHIFESCRTFLASLPTPDSATRSVSICAIETHAQAHNHTMNILNYTNKNLMGDGILFIYYHAQAGSGDIFQFCNLFLISGVESESPLPEH